MIAASCWCCPFQRIGALRKLRKYHPDLWRKLLEMDRKALAQFGNTPLGKFRSDWIVKKPEQQFALEDAQMTIFGCLGDAERTAGAEIKAVCRSPPDPAYIILDLNNDNEKRGRAIV